MKLELLDVNTNKLHDELIANGVTPLFVESLDNVTWITFADETDMDIVQRIVDEHDPTPLPEPLSEIEQLKLEQAQASAELVQLIMAMSGGIK